MVAQGTRHCSVQIEYQSQVHRLFRRRTEHAQSHPNMLSCSTIFLQNQLTECQPSLPPLLRAATHALQFCLCILELKLRLVLARRTFVLLKITTSPIGFSRIVLVAAPSPSLTLDFSRERPGIRPCPYSFSCLNLLL